MAQPRPWRSQQRGYSEPALSMPAKEIEVGGYGACERIEKRLGAGDIKAGWIEAISCYCKADSLEKVLLSYRLFVCLTAP